MMAFYEDLDDFDINIQIAYELDFNEYQGCEIVVPDCVF